MCGSSRKRPVCPWGQSNPSPTPNPDRRLVAQALLPVLFVFVGARGTRPDPVGSASPSFSLNRRGGLQFILRNEGPVPASTASAPAQCRGAACCAPSRQPPTRLIPSVARDLLLGFCCSDALQGVMFRLAGRRSPRPNRHLRFCASRMILRDRAKRDRFLSERFLRGEIPLHLCRGRAEFIPTRSGVRLFVPTRHFLITGAHSTQEPAHPRAR
jgi:hypothetical protein